MIKKNIYKNKNNFFSIYKIAPLSTQRSVNLVRGWECFVGLFILLVYGKKISKFAYFRKRFCTNTAQPGAHFPSNSFLFVVLTVWKITVVTGNSLQCQLLAGTLLYTQPKGCYLPFHTFTHLFCLREKVSPGFSLQRTATPLGVSVKNARFEPEAPSHSGAWTTPFQIQMIQ